MARRKKTQQLFDTVKRRNNAFGSFYNCRFKAGVESIPTLEAMAEAVSIETGRDVELRARNDGQVDRNGQVWIDLYPVTVNPFKAAQQQELEVTS